MRKTVLISLALAPFLLFAQKQDKKCQSDDFTGSERKVAKTTIAVTKNTENFSDLESFLSSLPDDKSMNSRNPPISPLPFFLRVTEENRNVKISTVYIFAVTRQDDNDFLLLLGSNPDYMTARFFDAEVSGLPEASKDSYSTLSDVRNKVKAQFGNVCGKPVLFMQNPIKASVEGSLLFDAQSKPGKNDPKKMKSKTSWEIHPVTNIDFY
jgi:hypothetical protein